MPAVPCGELNWQLRQDSNGPQMHRRRSAEDSSENVLLKGVLGLDRLPLFRMNRFSGVAHPINIS